MTSRTKLLAAAVIAALAGAAAFGVRNALPERASEAPAVAPAPPTAAAEPPGQVLGEVAPASSPAESLEPAEGETRYRIGAGSKASFRINEVLRGAPFSVVGATSDVAGDIAIDAAAGKARMGAIAADARTLRTDSEMRDRMIAKAILKSEEPENAWIVFKPTSIDGLPATIAAGAPFDLGITGDLTVAGVTRQVSFAAAAQLSGDTLVAKADTTVFYKDFGIVIPSVPLVAGVDDDLTITIDIVAVKG